MTSASRSGMGIRHVLGMRERVIDASRATLPQTPVDVWGEVLTLRHVGHDLVAQLRDAEKDDHVVQAWLPGGSDTPRVGDMLCVTGRLRMQSSAAADGAVQIQMRATHFGNYGASRRMRARRQLVEQLRNERVRPVALRGPVQHVTLVAPRDSQGAEDFCRILNGDRANPVTIRVSPAAFFNPASIAQALHEAAAHGDPVVIARGGGNPVAMDVFSAPEVVRAVFACSRLAPTILAVGHSSDVMLASQFVTKACHTPSHAAHVLRRLNAQHPTRPRARPTRRTASKRRAEPRMPLTFLVGTALVSGWMLRDLGLNMAWVASVIQDASEIAVTIFGKK